MMNKRLQALLQRKAAAVDTMKTIRAAAGEAIFTAEQTTAFEAAKAEAEQESLKAREALREQVAVLAVKGAEQILQREVNAGVHAELLTRLKTEL